MTTVREIGESALIERIAAQVSAAGLGVPTAGGFDLRLGIGDDAAAWRIASGTEVVTTDTVVEGMHFTQQSMPWADLGWKLWAANVSDVVSMGAVPLTGIVTLGLPSDLPLEAIDGLYEGMLDGCRCYGTLIVGGDIVGGHELFVAVAMNGVCEAEPLRRDTAAPGDAIAVTGSLGGSRGGLQLLTSGGTLSTTEEHVLVAAHRRPLPRVEVGEALLAAGIRCAMDVSDGLTTDLAKMCVASGVSARVDATSVPVASALWSAFPDQALNIALAGGEDYEILFAGPRAAVERAVAQIPHAAVIGEITDGDPRKVRVVRPDGEEIPLELAGWEHLR